MASSLLNSVGVWAVALSKSVPPSYFNSPNSVSPMKFYDYPEQGDPMLLALSTVSSFNALHFLVGVVVMICVLAVLIIGVRWLASLAGIVIPQPLMIILGILLFLGLFLWVMNWSGLYSF